MMARAARTTGVAGDGTLPSAAFSRGRPLWRSRELWPGCDRQVCSQTRAMLPR